jgi:hypothetical protein
MIGFPALMRFFKLHQQRIALILALAFISSSGSFALGVQVFAWAKMTTRFLKHDAPMMALRKTFDEKHPCEICKHLREMRARDAKAPLNPVQCAPNSSEQNCVALARLTSSALVSPPVMSLDWQITNWRAHARAEIPITPPPRLTLAT